jgi:hypothetical protein
MDLRENSFPEDFRSQLDLLMRVRRDVRRFRSDPVDAASAPFNWPPLLGSVNRGGSFASKAKPPALPLWPISKLPTQLRWPDIRKKKPSAMPS